MLTTPSSASRVYLRERRPRPLSVKSSSAPMACTGSHNLKACSQRRRNKGIPSMCNSQVPDENSKNIVYDERLGHS